MRKKSLSLVSMVCLPLLACGSSDNGTKVKVVDAKTFLDGSGSGSGSGCKAPASYPGLGSGIRAYDIPPSGTFAHAQELLSKLGSADYFDMYLIGSAGGSSVWPAAIGPASVDLSTVMGTLDPELDLYPQAVLTGSGYLSTDTQENGDYIGFAGTVNFTMAGGSAGTTLAGSLTGVEFDHVLVASDGSLSDPMDGCSTTIASASFSTTLMANTANFLADGQTISGEWHMSRPTTLKHRHF
jgi:hypothetical protein